MAAIGTCAADSDAMKNRRRTKTKTKRPSAPNVSGRRNPSSTNANTKIALLKRERDEAIEQQKATAEVLRVISASPGDLKPAFAVILENATRLCQANFGVLFLCEGDAYRAVAMHNAPSAYVEAPTARATGEHDWHDGNRRGGEDQTNDPDRRYGQKPRLPEKPTVHATLRQADGRAHASSACRCSRTTR